MDWKEQGLKTVWHTTREFEEHIKAIRAMFEDDLFRVAGDRCPKFVWEIKQWRVDERTGNQLDINNHAMSNFRYAVANIKKIRRKALRQGGSVPGVRSIQRTSPRITRTGSTSRKTGPIAFSGGSTEFDRWRAGLGGPITKDR